ncbi:unnamed protein product [Bathycoccus prasinos]
MTVRPKQAKVVLNKRNGNTKEAYRNSMKAVDYYKNFFNEDVSGAKMDVRWRTNARGLGLPQNDNKYFDGYQICATGIRNFVAAVGIPFSFDAYFSKHTYYKGVYGNLVSLLDTKADTLTHVRLALTTDESEQESLYIGLFNASECNNADSELAKRMKESVSCVIGDGSAQFLNAAQTTFGHQKPIATCSLHVKENVRKSCNEKVRDKENAILEAAEKLRGKILTPWARSIFEINEDAMRTYRIGNGNIVPVINPDAAVEVVKPNENGNQREARHHFNLNARTCTCTTWHFNGIACCHAMKAWDLYRKQQNDIPVAVYGRRLREWAVNSKPWFLAAKFIEAADVSKTERIKLPADANIEEDDMLFPPICLARLNLGVAVALQGRPRRRRINGIVRRCRNCNQAGHIRSKCRFNYVWFDWNDTMTILSKKYTGALFGESSKQCELILVPKDRVLAARLGHFNLLSKESLAISSQYPMRIYTEDSFDIANGRPPISEGMLDNVEYIDIFKVFPWLEDFVNNKKNSVYQFHQASKKLFGHTRILSYRSSFKTRKVLEEQVNWIIGDALHFQKHCKDKRLNQPECLGGVKLP